ncbi:MAG: enoyl-CoA hydratase-related protein [Ilumatobacteraceae bacterium]
MADQAVDGGDDTGSTDVAAVVQVEDHGDVRLVRLNRPHAANSLDPDTIGALGRAFADAEHDDRVRSVVLTGAGDRVFCAGMDLKAFTKGRRGAADGPGLDVFMRRTFPKPIIAAVNGTAVAGGFELVLACDMVVAAEHARFGIPEVKRGLVAAGGGTRLPRRLPLAIALELGLTGEMIDAQRALALGLVNRVVPATDVLATAFELAAAVSANGPLAVTITKQLMYDEVAGVSGWDHIRDVSAPAFASADAQEGATAFAEKRLPRWTGR